MNVFGQLKKACLEILSTQPAANTQGRVWFNSTTGKNEFDNGAQKRALLANDDKLVIGNSGTAASNARLHRGAAGVTQVVPGDDVTAEGSLSSSLNQISARQENYSDAGKPAFGNGGRLAYITDLFTLGLDIGSAWKYLVDTNTAQTLTNKVFNAANNTLSNVGVGNLTSGAEPNGRLISADGVGGAVWVSATGVDAVRSVTTTDTCTNADDTLILSGASFTQTLFTAVGNNGKKLKIIHNGTSLTQVYTINTTGGQTVAGVASGVFKLFTNGEALELISDNVNWTRVSHHAKTAISTGVATTITASGAAPVKGTMSVDTISWDRDGSFANIYLNFQQTGPGTANSGTYGYRIALPGGLTADTTFLEVNTSTNPTQAMAIGALDGTVRGNTGAASGFIGTAIMYDSTTFRLVGDLGSGGFIIWGLSIPLNNTTLTMVAKFRIKVPEWQP